MLRRVAVGIAARVITGPLAFFVAGVLDVAAFGRLALRAWRSSRRPGSTA